MTFVLFDALSKIILKKFLCVLNSLKVLVKESYMVDPSRGKYIKQKLIIFLFNFQFECVVTMEENIGNHRYIGTSILRIYRIYRRYIGGYSGKKYQ